MALAPEQTGIGIRRHFTTEGVDPYDELEWERRDARITNYRDGSVAFEQRDVEFPVGWSQNATNIVAQKYFRGSLGSPEREQSLRQVIDRVVTTITAWGRRGGYFVDDTEAEAFRAELTSLVANQRAAFNSPVWFNIGVKGAPAQASACQPYDALVSTPEGLVPIGKLVEEDGVGAKVFDAHGLTKVVAVKANGTKPVLRIHTKAGYQLDVTADHLVWRSSGDRTGRFVPAGELRPDDKLEWHRTESHGEGEISKQAIAEAALAGWLQGDGFVGRYEGTNRSLTIEAMTVTPAEKAWVLDAIDTVFPDVHRHERRVTTVDPNLDCRRTRLYGAPLVDFVQRWDLMTRGVDMTVPEHLYTAPLPVVAAYLRSLFQAEGYVSVRPPSALIGLAMISQSLVRGIQSLLLRFGIFSRVRFAADPRVDRKGCLVLTIRTAGDRRRFADEIGFIDPVNAIKLEQSLELPGLAARPTKLLEIAGIEQLGEMDVYDIQTESGEYLSGNLRVHNCFILAVDDTMRSILNWYTEEGIIFQGGSGSGVNLSNIRSSHEHLKGGGTASGPVSFMRGADASAGTIKCLQADMQIPTDHGLVPIRDVQPGWQVPTRSGFRKVEAVHDNGARPLVRLRTELGDEILCTPEHRFWVRGAQGSGWREAGQLRSDDYLVLDLSTPVTGAPQPLIQPERRRTREIRHTLPTQLDEPFALWLGWVFGDGSVTRRPGTNFVAVQIGDKDEELAPRFAELTKAVFGDRAHLVVDRHTDRPDASVSVRFCSTQLLRFLEVNGLLKGKADALRIPPLVQSAPSPVRASFLAGLFEADGHIGNGYPTLSTVSHGLALDVHRMLLSLGIPSKIGRIDDRVAAYGTKAVHTVRVVGGEGVRRFAKLVGFVSERKSRALEAALERKSASPFETQWFLPHVANEFAVMWEESDGELSRALAPYCRYRDIRRLSLLRARALLDRFPLQLGGAPFASFAAGEEMYVRATVEPAGEGPTFDLTVADAHEYLVDNLWTHNSGGKTRRAAKMVILNVDHPDIETFVWCKAVEERKARVLRDAGFDMDLDGKDSHSTQYQNANNSVRVTDEFMQAVVDDRDWHLRAVTTGETVRTLKARDLFRQLAEAAWECADPGMQFDTTINRWHTASNTGRINASNPCCFTGDTLVDTSWGLVPIEQLEKTDEAGQVLPEARSYDVSTGASVMRPILEAWVAGTTDRLVDVRTEGGVVLRCTPEHRFLTASGSYVEAQGLTPGLPLRALGEDGGSADDRVASVEVVVLPRPVAVYDLEIEGTHNFCVAQDGAGSGHTVVVHNSEYMHLDNSACNLASLNLMKFLNEDGSFDVEGFRASVQVLFTAQEILVGNADYPTEKIAETTRRFRQLGIGYANLGAMLMALGVPYDSDQGRAWAAAITALMTGEAYSTSARTAARMGPFAGYSENREPMTRVLRMHRSELDVIDRRMAPAAVLDAAHDAWDDAIAQADIYGVRNSQASVLAPTGCLVGGTLVPTGRGLVRLRSLGDPDGAQWQDLGIDVATDDGTRTATKFYVNGLEPVVTVETARGYRIQGTPQHRVKVVDPSSGAWEWKRFADVTNGDVVPLALNQLVGERQAEGVPPLPTGGEALPPLPEAYWTGEHHVEAPRRMTPELAELLGYFMGDGSLHSRGLRFCVADTDFDVVERLERLGKEVFRVAAAVTPKTGYTEVAFRSVRLVLWWEACGFAKHAPSEAHTGKGPTHQIEAGAHVPDAVLHSNDPEVYRGFLRGLFEADGTVTAGVPTFSSTTHDFAADVQSVLLALGYPTTRSVGATRTGWGTAPIAVLRLLNASYAHRWAAEIGFLGERKSVAVTSSEATQTGRHDYVPLTRALVDRLIPENGRLRRVLLMELRRDRVSRRIATELYERTGDSELGHLLSFFYDRVKSAELGAEELTYDLSVPGNVTYVANGFVSHNTIGLMMDCDTTGIEPDLGLCKTKKLVGGGTMSIVNQTVPRALRRLGYSPDQVEDILAYVDETKSILGAPHLLADHLAVFACSMGDNVIHHLGHVKMMSAVQPWISGAISKTVNVPETMTVDEVEQLHIDAWRLGLKALAIYRDNCKVGQPLSATKTDKAIAEAAEKLIKKVVVAQQGPVRRKMPRKRTSKTFSFRVADCHGYVTVGEYDDGKPGEIFLRVSKQGSTLAGIMDAFAISVSHGLQYGVPLRAFVDMYTNMRFEPAGMTDDPEIRFASSLVDYIFRRLAVEYLTYDERVDLGILTIDERMQPTLPGVEEQSTPTSTGSEIVPDPVPAVAAAAMAAVAAPVAQPTVSDAPYCYQCGMVMQRAGACFVCSSCGTTSGCS